MFRQWVVLGAMLLASTGLEAHATGKAKEFGAWKFESDVSPKGTPVCLLMSAVINKDIGQNIVIKRFANSENLTVDLYKDTWDRPQGADVKIMFDFVDNQPLKLSAFADAHILDIQIPTQITAIFLLQLAERPAMQVIFPEGEDEGTWVVGSSGAKDAVSKFVSCLQAQR